jgi:hypothetical protein
VAEEPPAQLVAVAAVHRVGEQPLLEMGPEHGEQLPLVGHVEAGQPAPLQVGQQGVLILGVGVGEGPAGALPGHPVDRGQAEPVGVGLVPVGAGQGPVEVGEDADGGGAGAVLVGREQPLEDRGRGAGLVPAEAAGGRDRLGHRPQPP